MTAPTLDDVKAFLARSIRGCDAVINGTRIGLTAEHLAEWAHERECFVVALAALDDAERWRQAERLAKLWVDEGCWCIPARDMLRDLTFAEAIDAEVCDAARQGGA